MTLSDVAKLTRLSWDTVKAITKTRLARDYGKPALRGVRYLGIDEIHVGTKGGFYTIVVDLEDGRILWVKPGRGKDALRGFWRRLRAAKVQLKAVATDMSAAYWSAVLQHLPEVALVFDKFHIRKLMNERLDDLRRQMVREAEGPLKRRIKGTRFLLLRNLENLKDDQLPELDAALRLNEPLLLGWYLKEELRELWSHTSRRRMDAFLKDWCQKAVDTGIGQMVKMAKTLRAHASGILAYADHPITSGKLEGINNKIKTLTKRSYGFHDENYFILRLLSLHHSRYKLLG
jgi:transposase